MTSLPPPFDTGTLQQSDMPRPAASEVVQSSKQHGLPGMWPALAVALVSGLVSWLWLIPGLANAVKFNMAGGVVSSELAQVDARDFAAALANMSDAPPQFLSQFKQGASKCPLPLAWVSVALAPGQPAGTLRVQSGGYISPAFALTAVPMRVAIPFPAPYEVGHGRLTVVGSGGNAIVALLPAWRVALQGGQATWEVTWRPTKRCA